MQAVNNYRYCRFHYSRTSAEMSAGNVGRKPGERMQVTMHGSLG